MNEFVTVETARFGVRAAEAAILTPTFGRQGWVPCTVAARQEVHG
ncbi:MAG: hypothetical protein ACKVVT_11045 [Dehalococcoidia bacterium]